MSSHATPRWANLIFGLAAPVILGAVVIWGYSCGYDFVQIVGFLWWNLGMMFMAWLVFGLFLYGVVTTVNVLRGRQRVANLTPATAHYVRSLAAPAVGLIAGWAVAGAVALWNPLGHRWSVGVAFAIALVSYLLMIRRMITTQRAQNMDEQALLKAQDEILEWNEDEDHKWYGI